MTAPSHPQMNPKPHATGADDDDHAASRPSGGAAMRLVVPLQGVVQGRGGIVLGSVIPCALFYLLHLYLKRQRPPPSSPPSSQPPASIPRTHSRFLFFPRGPAPASSRASDISKAPDSAYYVGLNKFLEDPYHSDDNPNGIIQLGFVENQLTLDLVKSWFGRNFKESLLDGEQGELGISGLAIYQPFDGLMEFKITVAGFMGQVMQGAVSFNPSQMIVTSGATPAIETLSFCLADPGNAFLVPSPYDPWDIKLRTGIELIPVPCRSTDSFSLSIGALERAYNQAKKRGVKVRAVLVSNPSNPVGNLLSRDTFYELLDFVTEKNIHLISDEMYISSTNGREEFASVAEILNAEDYDWNRVHIIYDLSKDLSLPGFGVGVIYSYNENVLAAARKLARFSTVSVPASRLLISMFSDTKFIKEYLQVNYKRLRKMYSLFMNGLRQLGIECAGSSGGLYCWADMSKFIRSYSKKGELELWEKLLHVSKINATPGSSCHCIEPGWFRCCFTTLNEEDVPLVMGRIKSITGSYEVEG